MKTFLIIFVLLALAVVALLAVMGVKSRSGEVPGLQQGRLQPCPATPNCVCSECPDDAAHHVAAIELAGLDAAQARDAVIEVITVMQGEVRQSEADYVAATFSSPLFGFVDDFEVRIDTETRRLQLRSASRVGRGDAGVNRRRAETFSRLVGERIAGHAAGQPADTDSDQ